MIKEGMVPDNVAKDIEDIIDEQCSADNVDPE